jgi:hypothetical protein
MASAQDLITKSLVGGGEDITIVDGKVAEIIYAAGGISISTLSHYGWSEPAVTNFNQSSSFPFYVSGQSRISGSYSTPTLVTFRIISNVAVGSPTTNYIPASAVVIPADSNGSVRIILESSADLITWTEANPGLYGSSSSKRFFRVRAVNQ